MSFVTNVSDPLGLPAEARGAVRNLGANVDALQPVGKYGTLRPVRRFIDPAAGIVAEVAIGEAGKLRLAREIHGRRWATRHGISTALIYDADASGSWLIGEWISRGGHAPRHNKAYVDAAVEAACAIAEASPPHVGPPSAVWRSSRSTRAARLFRGIVGGLPLRLWWQMRRAAAALPRAAVAHGDFYHRNVLWCPTTQGVTVVDWEYLGRDIRYGDLIRMWTILPEQSDRDALLERILKLAPEKHHRDIALAALWLTLRLIGENIKAPRAQRNTKDTAHARSMLPEAKAFAQHYGVDVN